MNKCDRCKEEVRTTTMSMFNVDVICMSCKKNERNHPDYKKAVEREREELMKGNWNFEGIGKPKDL
jgi:hypothetical protein